MSSLTLQFPYSGFVQAMLHGIFEELETFLQIFLIENTGTEDFPDRKIPGDIRTQHIRSIDMLTFPIAFSYLSKNKTNIVIMLSFYFCSNSATN